MALDFAALQAEFYARGFTYLNDAGAGAVRAKRWINDAMHEIDDLYNWPYLLGTFGPGASPLTVSDLRRVVAVGDAVTGAALFERDIRQFFNYAAPLSLGTVPYYAMNGVNTILVVGTANQISGSYLKFGPDLVNGADTPLMPDRYRMAIVHYAVASALMDKDNAAEAQAARAQGDSLVLRMRETMLSQSEQDELTEVASPTGVRDDTRMRRWPS